MSKEHDTVLASIGYYDDPSQTEPAFNPCATANCPVCGGTNEGRSLLYRSVMPMGGNRSYFFAYHKGCADNRGSLDDYEQRVMDEVFDWDDTAKVGQS